MRKCEICKDPEELSLNNTEKEFKFCLLKGRSQEKVKKKNHAKSSNTNKKKVKDATNITVNAKSEGL